MQITWPCAGYGTAKTCVWLLIFLLTLDIVCINTNANNIIFLRRGKVYVLVLFSMFNGQKNFSHKATMQIDENDVQQMCISFTVQLVQLRVHFYTVFIYGISKIYITNPVFLNYFVLKFLNIYSTKMCYIFF